MKQRPSPTYQSRWLLTACAASAVATAILLVGSATIRARILDARAELSRGRQSLEQLAAAPTRPELEEAVESYRARLPSMSDEESSPAKRLARVQAAQQVLLNLGDSDPSHARALADNPSLLEVAQRMLDEDAVKLRSLLSIAGDSEQQGRAWALSFYCSTERAMKALAELTLLSSPLRIEALTLLPHKEQVVELRLRLSLLDTGEDVAE